MSAEQWIENYNNAKTYSDKFKVMEEVFEKHDEKNIDTDVIIQFHKEIIKDMDLLQKVLKSSLSIIPK